VLAVDEATHNERPAGGASARPLGREVQVRSADGTVLHAEVCGPDDAPTVVLVHGWMCALRFWENQVRDLARDFRVVSYDLRGHGRSAAPASRAGYSTKALAADLEAVLTHCVPAGRRVVLTGHSLGAMAIVAWAGSQEGPIHERVAAIALVNTGIGDLVSESDVIRMPGPLRRAGDVAGRLLIGARAPLPRTSSRLTTEAIRYLALSPAASPAQVAFCEELILDCHPTVRAGFGRELSRLDLGHAVERLTVPTLVIASERDRLTPPRHAERLAETLPRLERLVRLPEVGHMAPIEAPSEVGGALRALADRHLVPGEARAPARARQPFGQWLRGILRRWRSG
jgi:pimeloyl-ACP methyl ester carboxylesterase